MEMTAGVSSMRGAGQYEEAAEMVRPIRCDMQVIGKEA